MEKAPLEYGSALTRIETGRIGRSDRGDIVSAIKARVAKVQDEERRASIRLQEVEESLKESNIQSISYEDAIEKLQRGQFASCNLEILFAIKKEVAEILERKRVMVARTKEIEEMLAVYNGEKVRGDRSARLTRV